MFNIPVGKKYKHNIKRLIKPNGLRATYFFKPGTICAIVKEDTVLRRTQVLKINTFLLRCIKKRGSVQFPSSILRPKTEKPVGIRMGKGRGNVSDFVVCLKRGSVLFQVGGVSSLSFIRDFKKLNCFLPCSLQFVITNI